MVTSVEFKSSEPQEQNDQMARSGSNYIIEGSHSAAGGCAWFPLIPLIGLGIGLSWLLGGD